ncbi:MAG: ribonuclease R [Eubacterium sp.]|nr:ribonuclease R [Eubacterium sp.]
MPSREISRRMDLRDTLMVTIDGEDSKDLDDAVSLSMDGNNYILGVHIADVSHYVREGAPLDREAVKRGTSVYFVDRVIPMLPEELSNGICSLNEGEDRLALSCIMTIGPRGRIIDHVITESVINVNHRMTYTDVNTIVTSAGGDRSEKAQKELRALRKKYADSVDMFLLMEKLSTILRRKRKRRGAVDFEFPESVVKLDENGFPVEVKAYDRNRASLIIEDFMLAANETVAEDFFRRKIPFVYRTHDKPDPDRVRDLSMFISRFGYGLNTDIKKLKPADFSAILDESQGTPEESLISTLVLRSMQRAVYTTENRGHFGLSAGYYCHFTSPIRRYPDLIIHRIIKETLNGKMNKKRREHYEKILAGIASSSSSLERRADEVERETVKMKKAEYMAQRVGETFTGAVGSLTGWGIYVVLPNTIEGMVRLEDIPGDFYEFDEDRMIVRGNHRGGVFKIGDPVEIRVKGADKRERTIDFEFTDRTLTRSNMAAVKKAAAKKASKKAPVKKKDKAQRSGKGAAAPSGKRKRKTHGR